MNTSGNIQNDVVMEESAAKKIKLEIAERPLNFATSPEEYDTIKKEQVSRYPLSHKIIEKRRRDRMNNAIADLSRLIPPSYLKHVSDSRLIPPSYLKHSQGRIGTTEIIETASKLIRNLLNLLNCTGNNVPECEKIMIDEATSISGAPTSLNGQGCNQFQSIGISENNMAMLNQDDQLRTLLCPIEQSSSLTSGYSSSSAHSMSESSYITVQSIQRDIPVSEKEDSSGSRGSPCSSEQNSSSESEQSWNQRCPKKAVYKFKHFIQKRFNQEEKPHIKSESPSTDLREDDREQGCKKIKVFGLESLESDSSCYLSSENSSTNSFCSGMNKSTKHKIINSREDNFDGEHAPLPAFVLHPLGTHYVPVTIHPNHFRHAFKDESKGSTAYHPISIPVSFCGPSISIETQVDQHLLFGADYEKSVSYTDSCTG